MVLGGLSGGASAGACASGCSEPSVAAWAEFAETAARVGLADGVGVAVVAGLLALVGVIAGVINAMAGGGSFLTLPALVALGLPPSLANGTNRVGVVLQAVASVWTFERDGVRHWGITARLLAPMVLGAVLGAWTATVLDDRVLRPVFGALLVIWALVLVVQPRSFAAPAPDAAPRSLGIGGAVSAVAIGGYGGFLQAGVGFPLLALLVPGLGYDPVRANSIKSALVLGFSLPAFAVFAWAGKIAWVPGLVLAAGTTLGGWLGTRWQLRAGAEVVRWFVVVMVAVSGAMMVLSR